MENSQSTSTALTWDRVLRYKSDIHRSPWPGRISEVPRKLVEKFLDRLRTSDGVQYSQEAINDLGLELSKESHKHLVWEELFQGHPPMTPIDTITAQLRQVKDLKSYMFRVVVNRHIRNPTMEVDWKGLQKPFMSCDFTWWFWLSEKLEPACDPTPEFTMLPVAEMNRPKWLLPENADLSEINETLTADNETLTADNKSLTARTAWQDEYISQLEARLDQICSIAGGKDTGSSTNLGTSAGFEPTASTLTLNSSCDRHCK
jgi:hypothetical protein